MHLATIISTIARDSKKKLITKMTRVSFLEFPPKVVRNYGPGRIEKRASQPCVALPGLQVEIYKSIQTNLDELRSLIEKNEGRLHASAEDEPQHDDKAVEGNFKVSAWFESLPDTEQNEQHIRERVGIIPT